MIAASLRRRDARQGVHPFDPYRDIRPVTELVATAFAGRLDPASQVALSEMRRAARRGGLAWWFYQPVWPRTGVMPGFVWAEAGRVVGNVSMRRALELGGFFIGNVSVHPDWRRRGIAGALMKAALTEISARGGRWVGLEVRADNLAAQRLYERLGFREVGRMLCMLRPAGLPRAGDLPSARPLLRRGRSRDSKALIALARAAVPKHQRPLLELRKENYQIGWDHTLDCWLTGRREAWWVADDGGTVCGAVRVLHERGRRPDRLEVLVDPEHSGRLEDVLVRRGIASPQYASRKMVETFLVDSAEPLVEALETVNFRKLHVLIQMRLDVAKRIPVKSE